MLLYNVKYIYNSQVEFQIPVHSSYVLKSFIELLLVVVVAVVIVVFVFVNPYV